MKSIEEVLHGSLAPPNILARQVLVPVRHLDFDGRVCLGSIVVDRDLGSEVLDLFEDMLELGFPIASVIPVYRFKWSDEASMVANNSSGFNYRSVVGASRLSYHATGHAIDINPIQNPYVKGELVLPPGAVRDARAPGTLLEDGPVVAAFESRGWVWGGRWDLPLDWHHFERHGL